MDCVSDPSGTKVLMNVRSDLTMRTELKYLSHLCVGSAVDIIIMCNIEQSAPEGDDLLKCATKIFNTSLV